MLSYRHLFHAGNFADVFKHVALSRLLVLLTRKDKPLAYLDTHAGLGIYDLAHPWAAKRAEYRDGIARVRERDDPPLALSAYLGTVAAENLPRALARYPGSPAIAARLLRPTDRMVLCELNRDDYEVLRARFGRDPRAGVHHLDAALALKAFLPPAERRGLVLVDPPFDRSGEFRRVVEMLTTAHRRWASGVFAWWYPLMAPGAIERFSRDVADSGVRRILQLELAIHPSGWTASLRGCGMLVVNPPFGFADETAQWLEWLWRVLSPGGEGGWRSHWLVAE